MKIFMRSMLIVLLCLAGCGEATGDSDSDAAADNASNSSSSVFHVSMSGNDDGRGSEADPWRTVQHAVDRASAGSAIVIHSGWYHEEVVIGVSGNENNRISIHAYPGDEVKIDAIEFAQGVSHVVLSGLIIEGFSDWGVFLHGKNHHIELNELTVLGGEAGIRLTYGDSGERPQEGPVSDVTIAYSKIRACDYTAVDCTPGPCDNMVFRGLEIDGAGLQGDDSFGADGLAVERGDDILVEDCYIHDNGGDGIDLNSRDTEGRAERIVVRRNRVVRNHKNGIKLWAGGRMENNAVWGQGDSPVWIGTYPGRCVVVNNTIAFNMWDPAYSGRNYSVVVAYPEEGPSAQVSLILANNIIAYNCSDALGGGTGLYLGEGVSLVFEGYNLYWSQPEGEITALFVGSEREFTREEMRGGAWAGATGMGTGNIYLDPAFMSGWPDVYPRLQQKSPAVDAGSSKYSPEQDIEGKKRPQGAACDIGAFEK